MQGRYWEQIVLIRHNTKYITNTAPRRISKIIFLTTAGRAQMPRGASHGNISTTTFCQSHHIRYAYSCLPGFIANWLWRSSHVVCSLKCFWPGSTCNSLFVVFSEYKGGSYLDPDWYMAVIVTETIQNTGIFIGRESGTRYFGWGSTP